MVPTSATEKLVSKLRAQKGITIDYEVVPGADHFFSKHVDHLVALSSLYMDNNMKQKEVPPPPEDFEELPEGNDDLEDAD